MVMSVDMFFYDVEESKMEVFIYVFSLVFY